MISATILHTLIMDKPNGNGLLSEHESDSLKYLWWQTTVLFIVMITKWKKAPCLTH